MKCFAYLRVSGIGQISGDGFDRQLLACETYAAAHGMEIAEVFRENGISGTKDLDNRPALASLLAALEENGVKTLICEKLDRIARNLMVQEAIIADLRKKGYTLISTCEPDLCSDDPSRVLIRQIFGALAQWDRAMTCQKLRAARERKKAKNGSCEGRKPMGHYPGEQKTMDTILAMHRSNPPASPSVIAFYLNAKQIPTRHGRRWYPATISKILRRSA